MRLPSLGALLQHPSPKAPPQEPGMAAAPARDAESMLAKVALECGREISASQEEVLANASFLGGAASSDQEEEEVFATQQQDEEGDPVVLMCTLPFTPTPSKSDRLPQSSDADEDDAPLANPRRKPRVGTRKVRGARIRTPTPSPSPEQQPEQQPQAEQEQQAEQQQINVDPLVRAVLMIPTTKTDSRGNPVEDFLSICRLKGLI